MNAADLTRALESAFTTASVRARRQGRLYQVEIPAYLADGDPALLYVRPRADSTLEVTDLGHTLMRLSYTRAITEKAERAIGDLAARHGFALEAGEIRVIVPQGELFAAVLGLSQVEAAAEVALTSTPRGLSVERFKTIVREALVAAFADRCQLDYRDPSDHDGLWAMDAVIDGPTWLGVAIVPSDIEAERALANKGRLAPELHLRGRKTRWAAIPRDINALSDTTRRRLMASYLAPIPVYDEGHPELREQLGDLADLAKAS